MNRKRFTLNHDLVALMFLVAMVVWFSHEMVWDGKIPFFRDLGVYFYPLRFSVAESFKVGELPLWDRHMSMGFPLLADFQSGAFYPPHLFYLILPFFAAIRATFLFHYIVAATGSYMLCRRWGFSPYLALIGAALFVFGGTIISLTNLLNHFQTAIWLPWALFFWEKALYSQSWKDFLLLTFILLFQFLAGSPELYIMSTGLLFLDGLRIKSAGCKITHRKMFFLLFSANGLLAGLAMVQILPTAELFFESRGTLPVSFAEHPLWSLHPLNLINLFFLDKEVDPNTGQGLRLFFVLETPLLLSHYTGAISLFGICFWLFGSSLKEKVLVLVIIIASLTFTVGGYTPVYPLFYQSLPWMSYFRFPEKFFFVSHALVIFVALRGLFCFLEAESPSSRRPLLVLSSVLFLFLLGYLFLRFKREFLLQFVAWALGTSVSTSVLHASSAVIVSMERQLVLVFGILFLFFLRNVGLLRSSIFKVLLVTTVFIDLDSAHRPYQYLLDPQFIHKGPRIIAAPDSIPSRLFYYPGDANLHPSYYTLLRPPASLAELQSVVFANLVPHAGIFYGFDYMQEIDALRRWRYVLFLDFAKGLPPERLYLLLGNLNVKYINSFQPLSDAKGITLLRHFPEYPSWLYKIDRIVPRAYVVSKVTEEKNPLKILDRLSSKEFNPLEEVILNEPVPTVGKRSFQGRAEILKYANSYVAIQASLNKPGVLVLTDSFYPGWRVYVDGKEQEILRANVFFRAVPLSAGEHIVEFRYEPRSFTIGLAISLATLIGVVVFSVIFSALERRRSVGNGPTNSKLPPSESP